MLTHHSSEDYNTAAKKASDNAKQKLEQLIEKGRDRAMNVVSKVLSTTINDQLVSGKAMHFGLKDAEIIMKPENSQEGNSLHTKALYQATGRADIPSAYTTHLLGNTTYGKDLLVHNLNTIYGNTTDRFLTRSVEGQIRGFLSDRFRRLDSRPIIESFAKACKNTGALAVEGYSLDTKLMIKAVLPVIYEPVPNEVLAMGVVLENSDFGHGALSVRTFCLRLWCTNFAIAEENMRKVHLGSRLDDVSFFSQTTHEFDTKTIASAIHDTVSHQLGEAKIESFLAAIKKANEEKIDPKQVSAYLSKRFTADDKKEIVSAFNSPDVENLPAGNTNWRLSNAISWIANQKSDEEEKIDFMKEAGKILAVK